MQDILKQVLSYLRGMWQYRWFGVAAAWVVCVVGWAVVFSLPSKYEATARVFVDTQSVLKPLLQGIAVQPNVDQQIAMMSRTLISRPNLERVIRMSDLDIKLKTSEEREGMIDALAKQIKLAGTGRDNLYHISYASARPEEAKRVVQSLLTIFVEGSLGDKRKDADSAKRFIDEQIKLYEQKLIVAENALKEFKRQNMGMMPSQGRDFAGRMEEASSRLNQARLELREAENAREAYQRQLASLQDGSLEPNLLAEAAARAAQGGQGPAEIVVPVNPELEGRINALKQKLDAMRLQYTEKHPDIIATRRVLDQLEEQKKQEADKIRQKLLEAQAQAQAQRKQAPRDRGPATARPTNPAMQQLTVSLAEVDATIAALRTRVNEYDQAYNKLKASANMVPQVEADLVQLNRDYEVNKKNFELLLARREAAQLSGDMESSAGVIDFRIVDPPRVPPTPVSPKRTLLMSAVLLIGLGAGLALTFLLSQIRPVFNDRATLQEVTSLPILGTVSMKWTDTEVRRQRRGLLALGVSIASLFASFGTIVAVMSVLGRA